LRTGPHIFRAPGKFYHRLSEPLLEFARAEFELEKIVSGATAREHLRQAEKTRQKKDPEYREPQLHPAPLPPEAIYLWVWFVELERTRGNSGFGPTGITYTEILAWATLTGRTPLGEEIQIIKRIDYERLRIAAEKA